MHKKIASVLKTIGTSKCVEKAKYLEAESFRTRALNLRDLNLEQKHIIAIADVIRHEKDTYTITSISFSYNSLMGDLGAVVLAKSFPLSLFEIGLVGCGIGDKGGSAILSWMKNATQLKMICIEQNNFSEHLKMEYTAFKLEHPDIMVLF